jgi:hypothetical protein
MTAEQTLSDLRQMLTHIIDNMVTRDDYNLESLGFRIELPPGLQKRRSGWPP